MYVDAQWDIWSQDPGFDATRLPAFKISRRWTSLLRPGFGVGKNA